MLIPFSDPMQVYLADRPAKLAYMGETFKTRMKRLRLRAGLKSQKAAAEAIGCERGTVGMWEAPSSAVDSVGSEYLLDVAAAYKVRPSYINTGEGDDGFPWTPEAAPGKHSQPVRLDPEMLRDVVQALQDVFEEDGRVYRVEEYPELFAEFYADRAAMHDIRSRASAVKAGKWIERQTPQGAHAHERDTQMPASSTHQRKTGGSGSPT
jgi:transcriptional regulator with XRE-family HTH domain